MNKRNIYSSVVIFMVCLGIISCSDKNDTDSSDYVNTENIKQNLSQVFPDGVPIQIGDDKIELNSVGLVSKIYGKEDIVTFDYSDIEARSKNQAVTMKISGYGDDDSYIVCHLSLNESGFVSYCFEEEYYDGECETQEWWFKYSMQQMSLMKRSEEQEETIITYNNGDITKVKMTSDDPNNTYITNIYYGNTPISNKCGIMLFDECFNIDLDEMKYAYYAGLLGKATKHLPIKYSDEYGYVCSLNWVFDGNGRPVSLNEHFNFKW